MEENLKMLHLFTGSEQTDMFSQVVSSWNKCAFIASFFWLDYFRGLFGKSNFSYFYFSSFSISSAVVLKLETILLRITYALTELQHLEWYIKLLVLKITRGPGMWKNSTSYLEMRNSRHWKQWKIPVIGPGVHIWLNGQTVNISK